MLIAIYSRKSKWTGKGESVENQLIMCKEYIESFIEGGKDAEIIEYEDEGFSGKNTKRPQFQKMMEDMQKKHFDYLVCYKLDRMGRNIADLATLMERLEKRGTSFVSIKEKFDTTTPIGKAMLYFSGVLAQMEREQIAERVRDNMIMLARSGRWLGGNTPLGFVSKKMEKEAYGGKTKTSFCLETNAEEIELVRFIFQYFAEKQSLTQVVSYLLENDIKTRNGKEFAIMGVRDILTNPVYCMADEDAYNYFYDLGCQVCIEKSELDGVSGLTGYAKSSSSKYKNQSTSYEEWIIAKGHHKGVVTGKQFIRIQKLLAQNKEKGENFKRIRNEVALLSGVLSCSCGHQMRPKNYPASRVNEKGERTFAYLCPFKDHTHGTKCQTPNVHGNTLDNAVVQEILKLAKPDEGVIPLLMELKRKIADSDLDTISKKQLLIQEQSKKKEQIKNLVESIKKMGANSISASYINEEIEKLDMECRELQKSIDATKEEATEKSDIHNQLDIFEKGLSDFSITFDTMTAVEKREFLRTIIDKVVWDGELAHIYLRCPVLDGKHRTFLCRLMDKYKQQWMKKFPLLNHRITAAAGTYDCQKFPLFHTKGNIL